MQLELDFLKYQSKLRITRSEENTFVFDPIRKKEVVMTPEELLRQLVLQFLIEEKKYPLNRIRSEYGIEVNGLKKRCDIVVFDKNLKPWLLIECKSPKVKLSLSTFEQAARYNLKLKAPYLAITNGLGTMCARLDFEKEGFEYLPGFPDLASNS